MQKNEFEKNVQQRMDDLQLYPSAELWPEVERRIRKERKRRWFIFWFLFPILLIGTGTAIYFLSTNNKKSISQNDPQKKIEQPIQQLDTMKEKKEPVNNDQPVIAINGEKIPMDDPKKNETVVITKTNNDTKQQPEKNKTILIKKNDPSQVVIDKRDGARKRKQKNDVVNVPVTTTDIPKTKQEDSPAIEIVSVSPDVKKEKKEDQPVSVTDTTNNSSAIVDNIIPPVDSVKTDLSKPILAIADSNNNNSKPRPLAKKKPSKWEFGFTFNAGLSNRAGGVNLFASEKSLNFSIPGGSVPGPTPSPTRLTIPNSNAGIFLETGIYAKLSIRKKTAVSFGLIVSSFGMKQPTEGSGGPAALASYVPFYNNRYYYLQFPIQYHWQINKGKKIPLVWQNGLSPALLFASNAVVYDDASNTFRRRNSSLNKGALFFNSGLYGRFGERSHHPFSAGLLLNYQLTGLQHADQYKRNQLLSVGIQFIKPLKKN